MAGRKRSKRGAKSSGDTAGGGLRNSEAVATSKAAAPAERADKAQTGSTARLSKTASLRNGPGRNNVLLSGLAFLVTLIEPIWAWSGFDMHVSHGAVVFYIPLLVYDLVAFVFTPINLLITALTSRLLGGATARDYSADPAYAPAVLARRRGSTDLETVARNARRGLAITHSQEDLVRLFDTLPGTESADMMHTWTGKILRTGSYLDWLDVSICALLEPLGVRWGKRYRALHVGDPLIINICNRLVFPVPVWGNVGIPETVWRGKTNATMVYNNQPWHDHFRVLDDGRASGEIVLLGNWVSHNKIGGWFTLTANPAIDRATAGAHAL